MSRRLIGLAATLWLLLSWGVCFAGDVPKVETQAFPSHDSAKRIAGHLVRADFVRRQGEFRTIGTGELRRFQLPPYGSGKYLNAEADLRHIPLGTYCVFFLHPDADGNFTRLATLRDQFTLDAEQQATYRIDEIDQKNGWLHLSKRSADASASSHHKARVTEATQVWKGAQQISLSELAVGDELLLNLMHRDEQSLGIAIEIYLGHQAQTLATKGQQERFAEFLELRGVPGWVEKTSGQEVTVSLFSGDPPTFAERLGGKLKATAGAKLCVASLELRTYQPPVDKEYATIMSVESVPTDNFGSSGYRVTFRVQHMLEGFRRGRIVRVFLSGWSLQDQPFGESLMGYGFPRVPHEELIELPPKEYPMNFPFRTDYGNRDLPWYQLQPGIKPPPWSEHKVRGELLRIDAETQTAQFRPEGSEEVVRLTLLESGAKCFREGKAVDLDELTPGERYHVSLYQDDKGKFTIASLIRDEFSYLVQNQTALRLTGIYPERNEIHVAHQFPKVTYRRADPKQRADFGRRILRYTDETHIWQGDSALSISDLAEGDLLRVNLSGERPHSPSHCTAIWRIDPEAWDKIIIR